MGNGLARVAYSMWNPRWGQCKKWDCDLASRTDKAGLRDAWIDSIERLLGGGESRFGGEGQKPTGFTRINPSPERP